MSQAINNLSVPSTILITGASRGLGLALARQLAQAGHRLILDARGAEALAEAAEALRAFKEFSQKNSFRLSWLKNSLTGGFIGSIQAICALICIKPLFRMKIFQIGLSLNAVCRVS